MTQNWKEIWNNRRLQPGDGPLLPRLMAADGLDTGFGNVGVEPWRQFVLDTAQALELTPGSTIFEVGCGAGAFLYELDRAGCRVAGLDQSPALISYARAAMPGGCFEAGDAADLPVEPRCEVVAACGVFLYFPSLDYAGQVLGRMAARAQRALAILDVPDLARKEQAMALRRGTLGEQAYEQKYRGLDHLYYDRQWLADRLASLGFARIEISDQQISGYANASYRFNAVAFR